MINRHWMPIAVIAALLLTVGQLGISVASAQQIYTPERGSVERKAVLNAIRPLLEARLGAPVEFVVNRMNVYGDWAWLVVEPQRPGGAAIATNGPQFKMWSDQDGLTTYALLRQAYGQWNLIDYAIGPTDVFWDGDPLYAQFPRAFTFAE
ncbi:hypothetical protein [Cohaesibacter intestini]|uniref:hypothetical protein n=1 Tax=Cohaesibacter intestini TaxID=2211145 RepID=UPI001300668C|nr:hypothetical protein [Cohaesibacter intestini]